EVQILKARVQLALGRPDRALPEVDTNLPAPLPQLPEAQQRQLRLLRAEVFEQRGDLLTAAQERVYANSLLGPRDVPENHERIWNSLSALPLEQLQMLAANSRTFVFQGWYELAVLGKAWQYDLDRQLVELERWQQRWARHPASTALPQALRNL